MSGVETRSAARKRPASAAGSSATPLKSPLLSDLWQPAKRQARTASRAAPTLRSVRKKGGSGEPVALTGLLGTLPAEVSSGGGEAGAPTAADCRLRPPPMAWHSVGGALGAGGPQPGVPHHQPPAPDGRATAAAAAAACPPGPLTPPRSLPCAALLMQLLQQVLGYCSPRELGALEATCSYFIKSGLTDRIAKHFLKEIPRAKGLKPDIR